MNTDARELTEDELYAHQQISDASNRKHRHVSEEEPIDVNLKLQRKLVKEALKEGLKEWLDEKILTFGKWSLGAIAAACLALLAWGILVSNGWQMKPK